MKKYFEIGKKLLSRFDCINFEKVSRKNNQKGDELLKALSEDHIPGVWLEPLAKKSINNDKELLCVTPKATGCSRLRLHIERLIIG